MIKVQLVLPSEDGSEADRRKRTRYLRLAEAIASPDVDVAVFDAPGPADAYLLAYGRDPQLSDVDPSRAVLLDCPRSSAFDVTDATGVAGAVEDVNIDYWSWGGDMSPWLVGRKGVLTGDGWEHRVVIEPEVGITSHRRLRTCRT